MMHGSFPRLDAERFDFPKLCGARFPELVEGADADEGFHLFWKRLNAQEEIGKRRKYRALALAEDGFFGTDGQALYLQDGNTDGGARRGKVEGRSWTPVAGTFTRSDFDLRPSAFFRISTLGLRTFISHHRKRRSRLIHRRRQQWNPEPVAFQNINQRSVKAFAVGENGSHKFGGVVMLEPCGLVGLNAVSRAVSLAKR